jgi:AcrR family transcriptional regulator
MKTPMIRRRASQARSRATVEKILTSAAALIAERGADQVTMTEIAQQSGVVIGSLYQYFSAKSEIMRALLTRHNLEVDALLRSSVKDVATLDDLIEAVEVCYGRYFSAHQEDPFYRSIWSAVQTDAELQALDAEDTLAKAAYLHDVAGPLYRKVDSDALMTTCALLLHLALSSARFALHLPEPMKTQSLGVYQRMARVAYASLEQAPDGPADA